MFRLAKPWKCVRAIVGIAVGLIACKGDALVLPMAAVTFVLVPQACSSIVPVRFSIDGLQVGIDTFRVAVGGVEHTTSALFSTSTGQHVLSARFGSGNLWPDKQVTLAAFEIFADSLPLYCS
ncbi:MAG TPA: hypothetical protein VK636_10805 [Gemmatimonadaceae bacterium]|nr:hypothetical protein [Gemmatimonadaceae bacterium]